MLCEVFSIRNGRYALISSFYGFILAEAIRFEEIEQSYSSLMSLVNVSSNKEIYSSLLNSEDAFFDPIGNVIGTLKFNQHHSYQTQPYVANGYFGARIPNIGHGFAYDSSALNSSSEIEDLINGWPLFNERYAGAFAAGFFDSQENTTGQNFPWLYQYGWDSVISAIPQWTYLSIASGSNILDPTRPPKTWGHISNYVQNLSLENGVVSTSYTWLEKLQLQYEVSANKHNINLGSVTLSVQNPSEEAISIIVNDTLNFQTAQRCNFVSASSKDGLEMVVTPRGLNNVFGALYSRLYLENERMIRIRGKQNGKFASQAIEITIMPGESLKFVKLVGIYTSDLDPGVYKSCRDVSTAAKKTATLSNYTELSRLHETAWSQSLRNSSSINFCDSPLLSMASKASVYHINANMRVNASGLTSALSVAGLSSDSYGGQVFWDSDFWVSMGILPFNPEISKALLNYRVHNREQAIKNIESKSKSKAKIGGAIYPWTSGRFGNCTATGPCFDYEYHINAAIAYSAIQLYLSGTVGEHFLEDVIWPIVYDAATLFSTYVDYDELSGLYQTRNLTDPDEFAEFIDNGAYTNAAISMTLKWAIVIAKHLGKSVPTSFKHISECLYLPKSADDESVILEYSGMNSSIAVKQADVVMITYPLGNELISEESATRNLLYYATKQVNTGPAMTFSIFSIASSTQLESGCSTESYLLKSIVPFLRGPFAQFSEQSDDHYETNGGTHPAFPFLTAHGGFLQTILMGLLGMRFSYEMENEKISRVLTFKARSLSLFPKGVEFGEIKYLNQSLSIKLNENNLTITNNGPLEGTFSPETKLKVISHSGIGAQEVKFLEKFDTIVFNISSRKKSDSQSLTECGLARFINLSAGARGDVIESMHDGDNSTYWQARGREEARILINFGSSRMVRRGFINWGDLPARKLGIYAYHRESGPSQNLSDIQLCDFKQIFETNVRISEPFDPKESSKIRLVRRQNVTHFEFSAPIQCSHILIKFDDNYENPSVGAKVYDINFYST